MEESLAGGRSDFSSWKQLLNLKEMNVNSYSPLVLAYIGDGIYELIIRTKIVNMGNVQVNKMHKKSAALVKAATQAAMAKELEPELTEAELAVYKRGRNAKSASTAKNATMIDYRMATGLEALFGYLYLNGEIIRLAKLIELGLEKIGEQYEI